MAGGQAPGSDAPAAPVSLPSLPPREELDRQPATVLKDDGDAAARVVRYDLPAGPVVLKEWKPASRAMALWARVLMRREVAHYRLLQGVEGIPGLIGVYDDTAFVLEWVDGVPTRRQVPAERLEAGLDRLPRVLQALHERRFAHLDLHQRRNILIGPHGEIWLVDLGQGLDCSRGLLRPLLFPLLAHIDRKATIKFRARYAPRTLPEADRERLAARHQARATSPVKRFGRAVRALFIGDRP